MSLAQGKSDEPEVERDLRARFLPPRAAKLARRSGSTTAEAGAANPKTPRISRRDVDPEGHGI